MAPIVYACGNCSINDIIRRGNDLFVYVSADCAGCILNERVTVKCTIRSNAMGGYPVTLNPQSFDIGNGGALAPVQGTGKSLVNVGIPLMMIGPNDHGTISCTIQGVGTCGCSNSATKNY